MKLNGHKVRFSSLQVEGVDSTDYPYFCDAFFSYGEYENGIELTEEELDDLADAYPEVVSELAFDLLIN